MVFLLRNGDMAAFDAIYHKYCHRLYQFVFRYLKNDADSQEIVQEVFVKLWQSREKLDAYASFESFLFTIAYNTTISLLRKRISETKSLQYLKSVQQIFEPESAVDELQFQELNQQVSVLLEKLTPRQRQIFDLSRGEGLSHREIAEQLDISENTVKNHLVAVLKFLKSKIDNGLIINALFLSLFV